MKRSLLILFAIISSIIGSAQVWPEPGAVWHYDWSGLGSGGFVKIEYTSDSLFQGQNCNVLEAQTYTFTMDWNMGQFVLSSLNDWNIYTYSMGDSVFYWSDLDTAFQLLYDFGAQIGDSWIVSEIPLGGPNCSDTSWVQVVDTGTLSINGTQRPYFQLEPVGLSPVGITGPVVEGIGNLRQGLWETGFILPRGRNCDSTIIVEFGRYEFKCFESNSTPLYNPSGEDCEYLLTHLSISENGIPSINIGPNPFSSELFITSSKPGPKSVQLIDITGRVVEEFTLNAGQERIELPEMAGGIYLVRVSLLDDSGMFSVHRMAKEGN